MILNVQSTPELMGNDKSDYFGSVAAHHNSDELARSVNLTDGG